MMEARTYPRRGLHGAIVHDIGMRIIRGDLRPGESLPSEEELGGAPGISRTVLREAIKVLAAKRLVESRPKTGTRVLPRRDWNLMDPDVLAWRLEANPDEQFFTDVIELRRIIEPEAARLAASRATAEEIGELRTIFETMEAAVNDADAYLPPDIRFHTLILEASHNELLAQVGTMLRAVFRALFIRTAATRSGALSFHREIVDAIEAHDSDAAEQATRALIDDTAASLTRSMFG
jgi:DNA-binding FadR family transcriptional regulator